MKKKKMGQNSRRKFKRLLDNYYKFGEGKALFEAEFPKENKEAQS